MGAAAPSSSGYGPADPRCRDAGPSHWTSKAWN
uniref:Uncharacterized protein n=1 Tax=Rhizophora mucronata TaxID=61149 RepID=A0A2P2NV35_RHIMU